MKANTPPISLSRILEVIGPSSYRTLGVCERIVTHVVPIKEASSEDALSFSSANRADGLQQIRSSKAGVVICPNNLPYNEADWQEKTLVLVENPRLVFMNIVMELFAEKIRFGIHPTAIIHPEAVIHPKVYIGPYSYVGEQCEIGEGTIIHGHVYIYPKTRIGRNVIVHAGTVVGADGFGYERNEQNELEKFPHIGGVKIGDSVEIGSNVGIDRGTLGDTIIGEATKIDNLCHIAHNVVIGKHCVLVAKCLIGGSTRIGDYSWLAGNCVLRNGIAIGSYTTIGWCSLVMRNVPDNATVMGSPARPQEEFRRTLEALRRIAKAPES
jgi:UDP-3-O-[3-hydroxymyristoyl] glucosamine N-acyltransferase